MRVIRKAWAYYHEFGIRELLHRIQNRQEFAVFTKRLVVEQVEHIYPDVDFRVASSADQSLLSTLTLRWEESQGISSVASRLEEGDLAVLGVSPENPSDLMYVSWVSRDDRLFQMCTDTGGSATQACSRRIWVPARHRRRRLAERGLLFVERVAFQAGLRELWAFTLCDNEASMRLHCKLGYEHVGSLRVGRHLGKRIARMRPRDSKNWQNLEWRQVGDAQH